MNPITVAPPQAPIRKPDWLKVKLPLGGNYRQTKTLLSDLGLNTVCQEAGCPNIGDCYERNTATFLLLGQLCTRGCTFCDIKRGKPNSIVDLEEPRRTAEAAYPECVGELVPGLQDIRKNNRHRKREE